MSSKSKDGAKLETSDYVDALSEAVMRILNYSNNDIFVSKCFSYLKVNTPNHARQEIQSYFLKVIGFANGPKEPESNPQRSISHDTTCSLNNHKSFDDIEIHSACASNTISYSVDETFEDLSFRHYPEQHMPSFESYHPVDQFSSDSFLDLANESLGSVCLTSTPYEKETTCPALETNLLHMLVAEEDTEDELEVLRCVNHDDDEYNDEVAYLNEEIESSYGSLNFSIPDLTEPTASEYSINFSHPEYLNESYLLRDLTDLLGQSDEAVEVNFTHNDFETREFSNKGIPSQDLIDKALSSINESLLADVQDNFQPEIMIASENPEKVTDFRKDIWEISSASLHKNYILDERQKNSDSKTAQNFEADESECVIIYDTSQNQAATQPTMISNTTTTNNNNNNLECNDVDLIFTYDNRNDGIETEKSADNNKLDSKTERLSTEEKLLSSSGNPREKSIEILFDDDDIETQYECFFDSNRAVALENVDEKSTEDEDTDDDDESMPSHKEN